MKRGYLVESTEPIDAWDVTYNGRTKNPRLDSPTLTPKYVRLAVLLSFMLGKIVLALNSRFDRRSHVCLILHIAKLIRPATTTLPRVRRWRERASSTTHKNLQTVSWIPLISWVDASGTSLFGGGCLVHLNCWVWLGLLLRTAPHVRFIVGRLLSVWTNGLQPTFQLKLRRLAETLWLMTAISPPRD